MSTTMFQTVLHNVENNEAKHESIFEKFRASGYAQFMTLAGIPGGAVGSAIGIGLVGGAAMSAVPLLTVVGASLATAALLSCGDKIGKGLFSVAKGIGSQGLEMLSGASNTWKNIQATRGHLDAAGVKTTVQYLDQLLLDQGLLAKQSFRGIDKGIQKDLLNGLGPEDFLNADVVKMHKAFHIGTSYATASFKGDETKFFADIAKGMNEYFKHDGLKDESMLTRVRASLSDRFKNAHAEKRTVQALDTFDAAQKMQDYTDKGLKGKSDFFSNLKKAGYDTLNPEARSPRQRQEPTLG